MQQIAWHNIRDAIAWCLAAFGISAEVHVFLGGLFLGFAAGYLAAIWMPENERRELRLMLFTALTFSIFVAILHPFTFPDFPLQAAMAISGFFSRYVVAILLKISGRTMIRSNDVADGLIEKFVPTTKKKEEDK